MFHGEERMKLTKKYYTGQQIADILVACLDYEQTVSILNYLAKEETADVEAVVRCKDCKYWKDIFLFNVCELFSGHREEDDYCSYGEREDA